MSIPPEAIAAAFRAWPKQPRMHGITVSREDTPQTAAAIVAALDAAAPLIAADGALAERERIRRLAVQSHATYPYFDLQAGITGEARPFTDLLGGDAP